MSESRLTQQQRQFIKQRANGCCEYCLSTIDKKTVQFRLFWSHNRICGNMISVQLAFLLPCQQTILNCKPKRGEF